MAVLIQRIIPADYAFVIHTTNPTNNSKEEIYVESCLGLGEALVSNMSGYSFSFTYNKENQTCKINSFPNKMFCIKTKSDNFMFRSDSNSEDLPGFAGAGLFDSFPLYETIE